MEIQPIKNVCNLMLYTNLVRCQQPINGVDIRKSRGQVIEVFFEIFYVICQVRFVYLLPKLYYVEKAVRRGCFKYIFSCLEKALNIIIFVIHSFVKPNWRCSFERPK
jgi:hypothetical protein